MLRSMRRRIHDYTLCPRFRRSDRADVHASPPFLPRLTTALLSAALTLTASQALPAPAAAATIRAAREAAGKTRAMVKTSTRTTARPRCPTCPPTPSVNSPPSPMAAAAPPHLRRRRRRGRLLRRRQCHHHGPIQPARRLGLGRLFIDRWQRRRRRWPDRDGRQGQCHRHGSVGGRRRHLFDGRQTRQWRAGLYLDKGTIQNAGLIFGGMGGYNDGAALRHRPRRRWRRRGRAAQWPHGQ